MTPAETVRALLAQRTPITATQLGDCVWDLNVLALTVPQSPARVALAVVLGALERVQPSDLRDPGVQTMIRARLGSILADVERLEAT